LTDVIEWGDRIKWKWAGQLIRTDDGRKPTEWRPRTTKKNSGRQITRWKDDIHKLVDPVDVRRPTEANGDELERLITGDGPREAEDDYQSLVFE